ncbi:MAG: B12-binding domain-containing radical SAM protein [Desulfomonilaceae bacterium]
MKILLIHPNYPQTFWSFDKVLKMTGKKALVPPLGLITLAALFPPDWEAELVDMVFQKVTECQWRETDVVMISGMGIQHRGILERIGEAKRRGKFVVVGGASVFHFPDDALNSGADIVVVGEAEVNIDRLIEAVRQRQSGIIISSNARANMEESPIPRFELLELDKYVDMAIQYSRGCPFQCEFCDVTLMLGRKVRTKSPSQVIGELTKLYDLGWRRLVFFVDDNFIGNIHQTKLLLKELVPWMESRGMPFNFSTQASVNMAKDSVLLEQMFRAGFFRVFLGIETPDEETLKEARKYQNTGVDLVSACKKISGAGFQVIAGTILGFDNEKSGAGKRLIEFANQTNIPEIFATLLQAGPGTDMWVRLEKQNRLLCSDFDTISNQTGLINFVPTRSLQEIVSEFVDLYETLYDPKNYLKRVYEHYSQMNPPKVKKSFKLPYLMELKAALTATYRNGFVYESRLDFWNYLFKAIWRFPDRFDRFVTALVVAEHYYEFRQTLISNLSTQMEKLSNEEKNQFYIQEIPSPSPSI